MVNKQDYLNSINQNIEMVRGDTLNFNFQLSGLENQAAYEALTVTFAVANDFDDAAVIEVTSGDGISLVEYTDGVATFSVCVSPELTKDIDVARYYYDLQIKDDANVLTLMRGSFTLLYDIAD